MACANALQHAKRHTVRSSIPMANPNDLLVRQTQIVTCELAWPWIDLGSLEAERVRQLIRSLYAAYGLASK